MKSRWYYRLPVKAAALVLLFAMLSAMYVGFYGVMLCGEAGLYREEPPDFADSGLAWQVTRKGRSNVEAILSNCAHDGEMTLSAQEFLERMQASFSAENSNLRVILECDYGSGLLPLESLLGIPERGALSQNDRLIRVDEYSIPVQGGAIGSWVNVSETAPGRAEYWGDYAEYWDYEGQGYDAGSGSDAALYDIRAYYYLDTMLPVFDDYAKAELEFHKLRRYAYPALVLLIGSLLLSLPVWVYLMRAAGHRAGDDENVITLRFMDRIPYDLFAGFCFVCIGVCTACLIEGVTFHRVMSGFPLIVAWIMSCCALGTEILFAAFTLSTAVRWKSHTLLRNTIVWRVCACFWHGLASGAGKVGERIREASPDGQKQEQRAKAFNKIGEGARGTAGRLFGAIGAACAGLWHSLGRGFDILPVVWKGVLLLAGVGAANFLCFFMMIDSAFFTLVMLLFDMFVLWHYLDILRQMVWLNEGAKKIAAGDLNYRLPTDAMKWEFKAHGEALNTIRGGIDAAVEERVKAVEERIKSDRMRNELLTNVSHDIKTPLTSIINYVDLLKKEDVEGEKAREYIEVLDRQSIRLKKLLEDLLEASKASTGNITVSAAPTNVGELLRQVAGEYAEKLAAAKLEPIITLPGRDAVIFADGRLLWRVFDNLMANIVKYAMPQTRVYLDLQSDMSMTVVAVKNVSRERLNIAADELMERFVRGDASRATEGSGLGLSIAQSLTELMGGTFDLMIDGDLFKVQISFPTLKEPPSKPDTATEGGDTPQAAPEEPGKAGEAVMPGREETAEAEPAEAQPDAVGSGAEETTG